MNIGNYFRNYWFSKSKCVKNGMKLLWGEGEAGSNEKLALDEKLDEIVYFQHGHL